MITAIFESVAEAITQFTTALSGALSGITGMFYTPGSSGNGGSLTVLGTLLCIAVGVAVVYWCFNLIKGLIRRA